MSFRLRISLVFTLLVGLILALFGTYLYFHGERLREQEFFERLEERAALALRFVGQAERLPDEDRIAMERALLDALPREALTIHGRSGPIIFERSASGAPVDPEWLDRARTEGRLRFTSGTRQFFLVASPSDGLVAVASAIDQPGFASLADLRRGLLVGSALMLLLTGAIAWGYATWTLVPVRHVVRTAARIKGPSERIPIPASHRADELGGIATTFNALLDRIEEAFDLQRAFMAAASHELRTPLTVVRGELHGALNAASDPVELRRRLTAIGEEAVHMQDLLEQLLWLAQTYAGAGRPSMERVRLDSLAERALERCRARHPHRPMVLAFDPSGGDTEPEVTGNGVLLTAALYNLLSNAAKYGKEGPVRLVLGVGGGNATAAVHDRGDGIPAGELDRVRGLFYRAGNAAPLEGHGVGLALVDRIAQVHQGRLEFETVPGEGSIARLVLPLADGEASTDGTGRN